MSEEEEPIKRRTVVYGPDGMRLVTKRTKERRRKDLDRRLAKEQRLQLYGEYAADGADEKREGKRLREDVRVDAINPRVRKSTDEVDSSDTDCTPARIAEECQRVAMQRLFPHNDDSETITSSCDEIFDCNDATPSASSSESEQDDNVGFGVEDSALMESSSPEPTDNGASSPISADFDRNNYTSDKLEDYLRTVAGDAVMFTESDMRCWQVVLVVNGLCNRFSLNGKARRGLIDAIKLFAGPRFINWDITDYYLSKIFDPPDEATVYHFYCELCYEELESPVPKGRFKNHATMCQKCERNYALTIDAPNSFVSLDLEYQITSLLHLKVVNEDLATNLANLDPDLSRSPNDIRDVYDGSLYKKILSETPRDSRLLTCGFNTDGAPLFSSSQRAFWPILVIINELSPRIRFRYPLLAGMCIVRKEPSPDLMNTYMRSFVTALQRLGTIGFDAQVGGKTVHFVLKPLFCGVDSVARPLLQNRLQFNGYFGCSWCYSKGEHVNGCMRFLMEEPDPMTRTHSDYISDVEAAIKKNMAKKKKCSTVGGVRCYSVLILLKSFDMIWGFSRDYLHGDAFGVILQLMNMFGDPNCPVRLTKTQMDVVNERLMRMTPPPPKEVHRLVRPIKTEKCKWKASEWRSWLLFYAIPCLTGILDPYALQHLFLYVRSMFTLLQTSISDEDLTTAGENLERFVIIFQVLYGARYVTFNVHTVKHAVDTVRSCGPLWATSAFPFESTIHNLKQCIYGPKSVAGQMTKNTIQRDIHRSLLQEADVSPPCSRFLQSLFQRTEVASYARTALGSVVFLGSGFTYTGADPEILNLPQHEINAFKRCVSSGILIHSAASDKETKKSDHTVFRTETGKFVQVLHLIEYRETAVAQVACFTVEKVIVRCEPEQRTDRPKIADVTMDHLVRVVGDDGTKLMRVERLIEKCIVIRVDEETYISRMPNTIEIQ